MKPISVTYLLFVNNVNKYLNNFGAFVIHIYVLSAHHF